MLPMIVIWIVAIVLLVIFEAITTQLVGIWFAIAALISLILALVFDIEIWVQIVVFIVTSTILLLITRPMARRLLKNSPTHTNADRAVGETGIVIEEIDNDKATGQVKVMGQTWSARSLGGGIIPIDAKVTVNSIDGVKLIVEPLAEEAAPTEETAEETATTDETGEQGEGK